MSIREQPGRLDVEGLIGSSLDVVIQGETWQQHYDRQQQGAFVVSATRNPMTGSYSMTVKASDGISPVPHPPEQLMEG